MRHQIRWVRDVRVLLSSAAIVATIMAVNWVLRADLESSRETALYLACAPVFSGLWYYWIYRKEKSAYFLILIGLAISLTQVASDTAFHPLVGLLGITMQLSILLSPAIRTHLRDAKTDHTAG